MSEHPAKAAGVRRAAYWLLAAVLLLVLAYVAHLAIPRDADDFIARRGTLVDARVVDSSSERVVRKTVYLESSSGLEVRMRVMRPVTESGETLPVIILMGGEGTGKDAVDLVGPPRGIAYVALDYPYDGDKELDAFWESLGAVSGIQQAFLDSPAAMSLALDWVEQQGWYDDDNVELVGASLGVPFTAVAGAIDERYTRVWLLHGGAKNVPWVMHVGRRYVENEFLRGLLVRGALLLVHGSTFRTLDWIAQIAPRPLVIVMAKDDDFVPREAQEPFVGLGDSDNVELIWTEGLHIRPTRREELKQLLDIVLSRIDHGDTVGR